jgi:hypothetical protein
MIVAQACALALAIWILLTLPWGKPSDNWN